MANPTLRLAAPIVFLFNGGEETLSQASNGFFASSRWGVGMGGRRIGWVQAGRLQEQASWPLPATLHDATTPRLHRYSHPNAACRPLPPRFARDLGAFINLESTGPWGPPLLFQHTGKRTQLCISKGTVGLGPPASA